MNKTTQNWPAIQATSAKARDGVGLAMKIAERLQEIQDEIEELLDEAMHCIRDAGGSTAQADAYWKAHIICALRNDHGYLGGSMVTMQDTIEGLEEPDEDDDGPGPDNEDAD